MAMCTVRTGIITDASARVDERRAPRRLCGAASAAGNHLAPGGLYVTMRHAVVRAVFRAVFR